MGFITDTLLWTLLDYAILGALLLTLLNLLINLQVVRKLSYGALPEKSPRISVLVPARNEALRIQPCASSLLDLVYRDFEVIILDDNSEDDTQNILRDLGYSETNEKFRLLVGKPLPKGWTGKSWACHQLAQAATGHYLLFTDADTHHAPDTLLAAITMAQKTRADLLTVWPRQITETWSEKLIIPVAGVVAKDLVDSFDDKRGSERHQQE